MVLYTCGSLRMHPLRLYHGVPIVCRVCSVLHYSYIARRTHMACMWFVARLGVDSLLHAVTNSVSFHHLQACHFHWTPYHLPQVLSVPSVGQLQQSGPGTATSLVPHTPSPLPTWGEAPLHMFAQPPTSTSTLGLILSPSSDPIPTGW